MTHSEKIKQGLAKTKRKLGRPRKALPVEQIRLLRRKGKDHRYIAEYFECSVGTICNYERD